MSQNQEPSIHLSTETSKALASRADKGKTILISNEGSVGSDPYDEEYNFECTNTEESVDEDTIREGVMVNLMCL